VTHPRSILSELSHARNQRLPGRNTKRPEFS
jgi:hypothetical protein